MCGSEVKVGGRPVFVSKTNTWSLYLMEIRQIFLLKKNKKKNKQTKKYILSNNRNLTVVNLTVSLESQTF